MERRRLHIAAVVVLLLGATVVAVLWVCSGRETVPSAPWVDRSPHQQGFVTVNGIRIEYLDWGGAGETIVLLAGLGASAHIYDELAPLLTSEFRVLGLTRRGVGASNKPTDGYDMPTLVADIRQALDALGIDRAILVGHSYGAQEAAAFATAFPDRVSKIIYVDGAYRFSPEMMELNERVFAFTPQPSRRDFATVSSMLHWKRQNVPFWSDACETDFRATRIHLPDGSVSLEPSTPDFVFTESMDAAMKSPTDFSEVKVPGLAIFADHQLRSLMAKLNKSAKREAEPFIMQMAEKQREQVQHFKQTVKYAQVVEMTDTDHMCITQRPQEVAQHIRSFLEPSAP